MELGLPASPVESPGPSLEVEMISSRKEDDNPSEDEDGSQCGDKKMKKTTDTLYFWDGVRKIDMVLAYEDNHTEEDKTQKKKEKREFFEKNLLDKGLELELEPSHRSGDRKTNFLKISAPWNILRRYAEIMSFKMPIKEDDYDHNMSACCGAQRAFKKLSRPMEFDTKVIPPEPNFFTAGFVMDREDRFLIKDRETFFSDAQRSMLVYQILMRTQYDPENPDKIGIARLVSNGVYKAAFPLHDGKYDDPGANGKMADRQILYQEWASPYRWYKKQPLWMVKRYFGDKIGLYFAWLGFYTQMLFLPAFVGLFTFLYGVFTIATDKNYPSKEICDETQYGGLIMCPQCDQYCPFWELKESCTLSKVTYVFDNEATIFFTIFMALWATFFLAFWRRRQAVIAWEWDLSNFEDEEVTRPEYEINVKTKRINPVTKKPEPYLPPWNKMGRVALTNSFVVLMLIVVIMAVFAVMLYRVSVIIIIYPFLDQLSYSNVKLLISMSAATLNLTIIVMLNKIYGYVAIWLTNMERPRTQTDFEDSYVFKMFLFQCINFYSSLVYIAFFKGKFFTYPGDEASRSGGLSKFKNDLCDPAGCLYELCIQLGIIMVGKQAFNNFIELLMPKLISWWKRYVYRSKVEGGADSVKIRTRWEHDYNLNGIDNLALHDEYLEMAIQYGFVTLFVAAFPLAPLFALINNIIEIRLDAYKFVTTSRRPLAQRVQDIGAWSGILQSLTYLSVATNALTIALSSDLIPHLVYLYEYSSTDDLQGYIGFSLSKFNVSEWGSSKGGDWPGPVEIKEEDIPDVCYYKGNRDFEQNNELSEEYFHIFAAKLAFIFVFEHFVLGISGMMTAFIPSVPTSIRIQTSRERLLAREILYESGNVLESGIAPQKGADDGKAKGDTTSLHVPADGVPSPSGYQDPLQHVNSKIFLEDNP